MTARESYSSREASDEDRERTDLTKQYRMDGKKKKEAGILPDREKLMSLLLPSPWLTSGLTTGFNTWRHRQTWRLKNCPQIKRTWKHTPSVLLVYASVLNPSIPETLMIPLRKVGHCSQITVTNNSTVIIHINLKLKTEKCKWNATKYILKMIYDWFQSIKMYFQYLFKTEDIHVC